MYETILSLDRAGEWSEIRRLGDAALAGLDGERLARAALSLAVAYEKTASGVEEYRKALAYAERAVSLSVPGSILHVWSLHNVAAYAADLAFYGQAGRAAEEFIALSAGRQDVAAVEPYVRFALGRVYQYKRQPLKAVAEFRRAMGAQLGGEFQERAHLNLVWALAQSGRPQLAAQELPAKVDFVHPSFLQAAQARVLAASGDWGAARQMARAALRSHDRGDWKPYDTVQAAEMALIIKTAAQQLGHNDEDTIWRLRAAALLACWNHAIMTALVLSLQAEGGDKPSAEAAHSSCGPAGYSRSGLCGVVG